MKSRQRHVHLEQREPENEYTEHQPINQLSSSLTPPTTSPTEPQNQCIELQPAEYLTPSLALPPPAECLEDIILSFTDDPADLSASYAFGEKLFSNVGVACAVHSVKSNKLRLKEH
ncbi:hypothetical protein PoB_004918000 [Plakobranchus ocellatus]|uniref:Uncharacterized protein n=1 Tax=Plakobranchus ocellatus TaxID=259542 RepID=A0AAV4BQ14_9GAST|nr:hypothetical protein PoB_004918000 [Plakobranchus ocellatus]